MNNYFDLNRFSLLFKKHTAEHFKSYMLTMAVTGGILFFLELSVVNMSNGGISGDAQKGMFTTGLLILCVLFTSSIFSHLGIKKKAIPALTLPAANFEKYLVAWLYSLILLPLVYVTVFYLITFTMVILGNTNREVSNELINVFSPKLRYLWVFPTYILLHAICFAGAIYFNKKHLIKSALAFLVVCTVLLVINKPIVTLLFQSKKISSIVPFSPVLEKQGSFIVPNENSFLVIIIGAMLLSVALWISAYFKLKEKQV